MEQTSRSLDTSKSVSQIEHKLHFKYYYSIQVYYEVNPGKIQKRAKEKSKS